MRAFLAPASRPTRRFLLQIMSAIPMWAVGRRAWASQSSTEISVSDFLGLSQLLVGREDLDEKVSVRALKGLTAVDPSFPSKASALWDALRAEHISDMSTFDTFCSRHEDMRPVALSIISAWYLGFCGTYDEHAVPAIGHPVDDAQYVSFAAALMYAPTRDATVIPSYSRGHTNYWFFPPKTIATD